MPTTSPTPRNRARPEGSAHLSESVSVRVAASLMSDFRPRSIRVALERRGEQLLLGPLAPREGRDETPGRDHRDPVADQEQLLDLAGHDDDPRAPGGGAAAPRVVGRRLWC
ncbi:hypothetical protein HK102_009075 [Quaeritorhiza haematococci]|nr:hypothetical protein HK102_009075 [Quaeritorhiza haematococci]